MDLETVFALANGSAVAGWLALVLAPVLPGRIVSGVTLIVPVLLSIAYAGLILTFWSGAEGGFGSLAEVAALFATPGLLVAGWLHYLAFDLLIGVSEVRQARAETIPHWQVVPCLVLTFLFGPAGWLAFQSLRLIRRTLVTTPTVTLNAGERA